jgi:hypothetical protein
MLFEFDFHPGPRPPLAPRLRGRWPDAPRAWRTTRGRPPLRAREALQESACAREVRSRIRHREPLFEALRLPPRLRGGPSVRALARRTNTRCCGHVRVLAATAHFGNLEQVCGACYSAHGGGPVRQTLA